MILYHGTNINFSTIDLSASHKVPQAKDFGKGFYLSDSESKHMTLRFSNQYN